LNERPKENQSRSGSADYRRLTALAEVKSILKAKNVQKKNIKIVDKFAKLWYAVLEESK